MDEGDQRGAALNGLRLVEVGVGDRETIARGHVAVGVIGEGGVDDAAGDRRHRMREGLLRRRADVNAGDLLG
jgi:hypothetical protein